MFECNAILLGNKLIRYKRISYYTQNLFRVKANNFWKYFSHTMLFQERICSLSLGPNRYFSNRIEFAPFGSKFFTFRKVSILKWDSIDVNRRLFLWLSNFGVRNYAKVLATPFWINRIQTYQTMVKQKKM